MALDFSLLPMTAWSNWLMWALATPVQFYVGAQYYVGAYKSLRNRSANMDVLIALGSSVAYFYSIPITLGLLSGHVYFETAAVIITLIRLGKYLEARAKGRTSEAIKKLLNLKAKSAHILRDGNEVDVPVDEVHMGDLVLVRPGEKVAVDGVIVEGHTWVDKSMLTGKSIFRSKRARETQSSVPHSTRVASSSSRRPMLEKRLPWRRSSNWWKRRRAARRLSKSWPTRSPVSLFRQ